TSLRALKEETKLELAKAELMRGRAPIKRIAEIAGFRNEKSFSRAFRQWTGTSPRDFRGKTR
ncbi:AraC family transcriptional regulator, partial [Bradyrhizobium guangdongense]